MLLSDRELALLKPLDHQGIGKFWLLYRKNPADFEVLGSSNRTLWNRWILVYSVGVVAMEPLDDYCLSPDNWNY